MAAAHISAQDLAQHTADVLSRARAGELIIVSSDGDEFQLAKVTSGATESVAETAAVGRILADPDRVWSDAILDDRWSSDMEAIMRENRATDRNPWQE